MNMTTVTLKKRYSRVDAQAILVKFRQRSFEELRLLFNEGKAPTFEETEGNTVGLILALNPKVSWWLKLGSKILFDSPFARWAGKAFLTPFNEKAGGKGINIFQNRILPHRFRIETHIDKSLADQNPCLVVYYPYFPSRLFGIIDELRRIDDGVFLGQTFRKLPRGKYELQGYFVLCALNRTR
jgi:hypothetical protein